MSNGSGYNGGQTGWGFNINVTRTWEQQNRWQASNLGLGLKIFKITFLSESWSVWIHVPKNKQ